MDLSREKEIAEVASGLSSNLLLCHRGATSNHSAPVRCLEVFVFSRRLFRLPHDIHFGTQHLRSCLCVFSDAYAVWEGFLHAVPCRHTDGLLDFSKKLLIPSESDADRVPRPLRRAGRCRWHHLVGLLSVPLGLASECEKQHSEGRCQNLLEQIRG